MGEESDKPLTVAEQQKLLKRVKYDLKYDTVVMFYFSIFWAALNSVMTVVFLIGTISEADYMNDISVPLLIIMTFTNLLCAIAGVFGVIASRKRSFQAMENALTACVVASVFQILNFLVGAETISNQPGSEGYNLITWFTTFDIFGGVFIYIIGMRIREIREEKEKLSAAIVSKMWVRIFNGPLVLVSTRGYT